MRWQLAALACALALASCSDPPQAVAPAPAIAAPAAELEAPPTVQPAPEPVPTPAPAPAAAAQEQSKPATECRAGRPRHVTGSEVRKRTKACKSAQRRASVPLPRPRPAIARAWPDDAAVAAARLYLVETATTGGTMRAQGRASLTELVRGEFPWLMRFADAIKRAGLAGDVDREGRRVAIGRLHPVAAVRFAAAVREARAAGLGDAGCFSVYRPPGLGVGGLRDKFASTHAYGLTCDMAGIGGPRSAEAARWHEIARRNGLYRPFATRGEWNHYAVTRAKTVPKGSALRVTITTRGPVDDALMWSAGNSWIDSDPAAAHSASHHHHHHHHHARPSARHRSAA